MQQHMVLSQHSCPLANTCNDINMSSSEEEEEEEEEGEGEGEGEGEEGEAEEDIIHTNAVERIPSLPSSHFTTVKK
jgi:hypothetical protein